MKRILAGLTFSLVVFATSHSSAQVTNTAPEDPTHQELRQLRDGLLAAMNNGNIEASLKLLHTNCVITWHNAEVSRGHEGVRAYHNRVMTGPNKIVESFHCDVNVDELTILYGGDTGICFGSSDEDFKLANGKNLHVHGRWSATLVKESGRWLVASLHASTNLFDNVLLDYARKAAVGACAVCFVTSGIIGWLVGRRRKHAA